MSFQISALSGSSETTQATGPSASSRKEEYETAYHQAIEEHTKAQEALKEFTLNKDISSKDPDATDGIAMEKNQRRSNGIKENE